MVDGAQPYGPDHRSFPVRFFGYALATALAVHPNRYCVSKTGKKQKQPIIATQQYGRGEVVYVGFNETWRLRKMYGERYYRQFWGQMIHRLGLSHAMGGQKRFVLRTDRRSYRTDDEVLLTVEAYDRLAVAAGLGVFLGTLPLLFCHTIAILFVCGFFRLNKVAAVSSSQLCMPPLVPALCIELGYYVRHGHWLTELSLQTLGYQALERIYEWFLGSLLLAPLLALLGGALTYLLARMVQREDAETS